MPDKNYDPMFDPKIHEAMIDHFNEKCGRPGWVCGEVDLDRNHAFTMCPACLDEFLFNHYDEENQCLISSP